MNDLIKETIEDLNNLLSDLPKYKRTPCKDCEYKLICAGECEKTLHPVERK